MKSHKRMNLKTMEKALNITVVSTRREFAGGTKMVTSSTTGKDGTVKETQVSVYEKPRQKEATKISLVVTRNLGQVRIAIKEGATLIPTRPLRWTGKKLHLTLPHIDGRVLSHEQYCDVEKALCQGA